MGTSAVKCLLCDAHLAAPPGMAAQPATISAYVKKLSKTSLVGLGGFNPPQGLAANQRQGSVNPGRRKTGHRTRRHGGLTPPNATRSGQISRNTLKNV